MRVAEIGSSVSAVAPYLRRSSRILLWVVDKTFPTEGNVGAVVWSVRIFAEKYVMGHLVEVVGGDGWLWSLLVGSMVGLAG